MSKEKCLCKNKSLILKKPGRQVKCCAGLRWFYLLAGMAAGCRAGKIGRNQLSDHHCWFIVANRLGVNVPFARSLVRPFASVTSVLWTHSYTLTAQLPPAGLLLGFTVASSVIQLYRSQALSKKRISALPYLQEFDFCEPRM